MKFGLDYRWVWMLGQVQQNYFLCVFDINNKLGAQMVNEQGYKGRYYHPVFSYSAKTFRHLVWKLNRETTGLLFLKPWWLLYDLLKQIIYLLPQREIHWDPKQFSLSILYNKMFNCPPYLPTLNLVSRGYVKGPTSVFSRVDSISRHSTNIYLCVLMFIMCYYVSSC